MTKMTSLISAVVSLAFLAVFSFAASRAHAAAMYTVTDLGTFHGGSGSQAYGINNAGQVVGESTTSDGYQDAFLYVDGQMLNLTQPFPPFPPQYPDNLALGVNNFGLVVGYSYNPMVIGAGPIAFIYVGKQIARLAAGGEAYAINTSGQVAGGTLSGHWDIECAVLYTGGQTQDLGAGTGSQARGINDAGDTVGYFQSAGGQRHAFLFSGGQTQDLGTLPGGSVSTTQAINNVGQIVGFSDTAAASFHAFLYNGGSMKGSCS